MAQISAADVAKLRKITGSGMMDCKSALEEANCDFDAAIEILRKKGQKIAAKREDRDAKEGCVLSGVTADGKIGAIVCVNCETDFVAKNEDFIAFTREILNIALAQKPATIEDLLALQIGSISIATAITDQMGKIGEKIELSYYELLKSEKVVSYIHTGNRLATLVAFNMSANDQVCKDVAMQVAAMNPVSVDKADCPSDIVEKEIEIGKELARQEGKPEEMLEKIALGKLNKFYKDNTLLNQEFVKDNKQTVLQYLQSENKALTVTSFKRYGLTK